MSAEETIATLAATLTNVQKNQDSMQEFNLNAFKRIMDKLDLLPSMQTTIAVTGERVSNMNDKIDTHMADDTRQFKTLGDDLEELKKAGWIQKGAAMVIGGVAGLGASFLHK